MSGQTEIAWTDRVWNPVTGCTRVSSGCNHCYAFALHDQRHIAWKRGRWPSAPEQYHQPFSKVQLLPERLGDPLRWRKPQRVFVNSMGDLFHPDVPGEFINQVWMTMFNTRRHTYQILTKRPERLLEWTQRKAAATHWPIEDIWPSWMWLGVSVEDHAAAEERIPLLLQTPAAVRFLSCEPLLGPIDRLYRRPDAFYTTDIRNADDALERGIGWVIAGGESGPHAREMDLWWANGLREQCAAAGVPFFMKQLGSYQAKKLGLRDRHGGDISEWHKQRHSLLPAIAVREWPEAMSGEVRSEE